MVGLVDFDHSRPENHATNVSVAVQNGLRHVSCAHKLHTQSVPSTRNPHNPHQSGRRLRHTSLICGLTTALAMWRARHTHTAASTSAPINTGS